MDQYTNTVYSGIMLSFKSDVSFQSDFKIGFEYIGINRVCGSRKDNNVSHYYLNID